MINKQILLKQAKQEKIPIVKKIRLITIARLLADKIAIKLGMKSYPNCFGILFETKRVCASCRVKKYCEYIFVYDYLNGISEEIHESDIVNSSFREGSRPSKLIKAWKSKFLTKEELQSLSNKLFNSVIDVDRIIEKLFKQKTIVKSGQRYGIKR